MSYSLNSAISYEVVVTDNVTLFKERIFPSMNITLVPANSIIASGSNNVILPASTIYVESTDNFPTSGNLSIVDTNGTETIAYTGISGNSFTGCTGGTGILATGDIVYLQISTAWLVFPDNAPFAAAITGKYLPSSFSALLASASGNTASIISTPTTTVASGSNGQSAGKYTINVASTSGFSSTGNLWVDGLPVAYTGTTGTSFTGCSNYGFTGVPMATGDGVAVTIGTTTGASSGGQNLPQSTIYAASTTGFPTSGNIYIGTTAGSQIVAYTGISGNTFTGCTGGTGTMETYYGISAVITTTTSIYSLPQSTIDVVSTTGFASSGSILVATSIGGAALVNYTGITGTSFTGCTGGTGIVDYGADVTANIFQNTTVASASNGQIMGAYTLYVTSSTGFPSSGSLYIVDSIGTETITYASVSGNSLLNCQGGEGVFTSGSDGQTLPQSVINVNSTSGFASSGSIVINTASGSEIVSYTGVTGTSFTGCSGGTTTLASTNLVFPYPSPIYATVLSYSDGVALPTSYIYVSIALASYIQNSVNGTVVIQSDAGLQTINYSQAYNYGSYIFLNGTTGGTGTLHTGYTVYPYSSPTYCEIDVSSNGVTLPATINVNSTAGFPSSGEFFIFDTANSGQGEYVTYTSKTSTSFVCNSGTGTVATGNIISNYTITQIAPADTITFTFPALVTGMVDVTNTTAQPYVLIGNSASGNDSTTPQTIASVTSSTSIGLTNLGSLPDTNNGAIIWALTDYNYTGLESISSDISNRIQLFVSDGHKLFLTQEAQDLWELDPNSSLNSSSFNVITISGNLQSINIENGSFSSSFQVAVHTGAAFSTVIENSSSYSMTFGYTSDNATYSSGTISIAPNAATFVFGDGTNIFIPQIVAPPPTPVLVNSAYGPTLDPIGTTYLIEGGGLSVTLPSAPADGTFYIFKDQNVYFNSNNPFTVNSSGSDYLFAPNGVTTSLTYTKPGLSFTLQYFATDLTWRVIDRTSDEMNPLWVTSTSGQTDPRQQDYYLDTSGGSFNFNTYDTYYTPVDGIEFSLKDAAQSGNTGGDWPTNPITIATNSANLEYPVGTVTLAPASVLVQPGNAGLYIKFKFDAISNTWLLLETNA